MCLIDEDVIDAKLIENKPVIFLLLGEQILETFFPCSLLLLDRFDHVAVAALFGGVFAEQLVILRNLLAQEFLLVFVRHANPLEAAVGDDDAVPVVTCNLGSEHLAAVAGQIFLRGDEQLGVGIKVHELAGELLKQVVRDHVHRLFDEAGLLHLHAGGRHRERLTGADNVSQQRIARTHAAPDRIILMRSQADVLVHAGIVEVPAVEQAGPQVVVRVVIEPHESLGALRVGEDPGPESFFNEFLLFTGGECFLLVDHSLLTVAVADGVVNGGRLHVEGEFQKPAAVGSGRAVVGGCGDGSFGRVSRIETPDGIFLQMCDGNARRINAEQFGGEGLDVGFGYPRSAQARIDVAWQHVLRLDATESLGIAGVIRAGVLGRLEFGSDVTGEISIGGLPGL